VIYTAGECALYYTVQWRLYIVVYIGGMLLVKVVASLQCKFDAAVRQVQQVSSLLTVL